MPLLDLPSPTLYCVGWMLFLTDQPSRPSTLYLTSSDKASSSNSLHARAQRLPTQAAQAFGAFPQRWALLSCLRRKHLFPMMSSGTSTTTFLTKLILPSILATAEVKRLGAITHLLSLFHSTQKCLSSLANPNILYLRHPIRRCIYAAHVFWLFCTLLNPRPHPSLCPTSSTNTASRNLVLWTRLLVG